MEVNDILGLGKMLPIDKLIDTISSATGRLSKSYFDKIDINTKAYEIKRIAEARAEEMKIISQAVQNNFQLTGGIEYKETGIAISSPKDFSQDNRIINLTTSDLEERSKTRTDFKEAKRQLNIESVTSYAAESLKNEPFVTDEPLDEDWKTRFFNIAEDISNEEMQSLWGQILGGEIKQPKSYSLRTLELLKNLTKSEAEIFTKFAQLRLVAGDKSMIYNQDDGKFLESEFGITFSDRLLLTELGLIASENNLEFVYPETNQNRSKNILNYDNKGILLYRSENTPKQAIQILVFTKTGNELSNLIQQVPNEEYMRKVCSSFKHQSVKIQYGDIVNYADGQVNLFNTVDYVD